MLMSTVLLTGSNREQNISTLLAQRVKIKQGDEEVFYYSTKTGTIQPVRIWSIGDFGTGKPPQLGTRFIFTLH